MRLVEGVRFISKNDNDGVQDTTVVKLQYMEFPTNLNLKISGDIGVYFF